LFSGGVQIVTSPSPVLSFLFVVCLGHLLVVGLAHLRWDTLHTEDFKIHIIAIFEHVWHRFQLFLMYLLHMNPQASNCVQPSIAVRDLAFVVFCFLVINENLQIIEVFIAVKAPRSFQKLFQRWPISLSF
jgi:hypothetical protein